MSLIVSKVNSWKSSVLEYSFESIACFANPCLIAGVRDDRPQLGNKAYHKARGPIGELGLADGHQHQHGFVCLRWWK